MLLGDNIAVVESLDAALDFKQESSCHLLHVLNADLVVSGRKSSEVVLKVWLSSLIFKPFAFGISERES